MGFRDYSPNLNRFLTRDTYNGALADLNLGLDPWTNNRYAFAGGNPITGVEFDGHVIFDPGATSGGSFQVPINNPGLFGPNGNVAGLVTATAATVGTIAGTGVLLNQTSGSPDNPFAKMMAGAAAQPPNEDDDNDRSGPGGGREPEDWRAGTNERKSGNDGIALGLRREGDLRTFADERGLQNFLDQSQEEALASVRNVAFEKPNIRIHVNLDGFRFADDPALAFKDAYEQGAAGQKWWTTQREMRIVGESVRRGERDWKSIIFYRNGEVVDIPLPSYLGG